MKDLLKYFRKEGFEVVEIKEETTIQHGVNSICEESRETVKSIFGITEEELVEKENALYDLKVSSGVFVYLDDAVFYVSEDEESVQAKLCFNLKVIETEKDRFDFNVALYEYSETKSREAFVKAIIKGSKKAYGSFFQ